MLRPPKMETSILSVIFHCLDEDSCHVGGAHEEIHGTKDKGWQLKETQDLGPRP